MAARANSKEIHLVPGGHCDVPGVDPISRSTHSGLPADGYTPANSAKQIIAGNGLTGGGTLAADRTLTLGTPGDITNSTINSVTSTSHTHALGFTAAEVYVGTGANDTSFPLGHIVALGNDANIARNASGTPTLHNSINRYYVPSTHPSAGAALAGTWRSRGVVNGNGEYNIMQRVA
ncbi:hypothetical protein [Sinorhizobium meliloti]|uniref:hypothetical protein n=1 Tax=Rhizobium meliloti TaxID=382 RepID=UPI00398CD9F1